MMVTLVTLVVIILLKCVQCHIWSYVSFNDPVNLTVINTFNCDSNILCASRCSSFFPEILMVSLQNDLCYCLETPQILLGSEERISLPSVYSRIPEVCISKGYQGLPDLRICVKFSAHKTNWSDAKDQCNQDGGYLMNLNTVEKIDTISNLAQAYSGDHFHIGGFKDSLPASFKWTRGGVVDSQYWGMGEPNGSGLNEMCLCVFKGTGRYLDEPCDWNNHFICEILF